MTIPFKVGDRVRQKSKEEVEKIGLGYNGHLGIREFTIRKISSYVYPNEWDSGGYLIERLEPANLYEDDPDSWV